MKKNKSFFGYFHLFFNLIFLISSVHSAAFAYQSLKRTPNPTGLFMGSIQYPHQLKNIPTIRIYQGGNKIKVELNKENKKLSYSIPGHRYYPTMHILIAQDIEWIVKEGVIQHLKVAKNAPYKLYEISLTKELTQKENEEEPINHYYWTINSIPLVENGKIPDNAIRVYMDPSHVSSIEGTIAGNEKSSVFELPKIIIEPNIIELVGSETELHNLADKWLLSSIDFDAIHVPIPQEMTQKAKTIITLTT